MCLKLVEVTGPHRIASSESQQTGESWTSWGSSDWESDFNAEECGFDPWFGKYHVMGQLSPCAIITEVRTP